MSADQNPPRPLGLWPECAAPYWWSRPLPYPASWHFRRRRGWRLRGKRLIALMVVAPSQRHDQRACLGEQLAPGDLGSQSGAIARQGEAQSLGQAVHGVGGKHAGARTTGGAGGALEIEEVGSAHLIGGRRRNCRDQVGTGLTTSSMTTMSPIPWGRRRQRRLGYSGAARR